jgi:hypothetical protein
MPRPKGGAAMTSAEPLMHRRNARYERKAPDADAKPMCQNKHTMIQTQI